MTSGRRGGVQGREPQPIGGRRNAVDFPSAWPALVLYALVALVITYPLVRHLAEAVPGDIGDPLLNTWIIAWDAHSTLTDPLGLFQANIFFPLPNTLAFSEHLFSTAALILPLGQVSGQPVVAYNLSLLLSFPLAGLGMYLLVLRWTQRRGAAFLAGLAYACTPYRLTAIAHLQLLTVQWLPYSLLALDRLLDSRIARPKTQIAKYWTLFVLFTTLQVLASWYLAVFSALVLGLYTLGWLLARLGPGSRSAIMPALGRLVAGALVVTGLTLPFALPYLEVLPQLQAARPASLAASFAAQPGDFLVAPSYLRVSGPLTRGLVERTGFTEENQLFPGVVAPLLALVGLALGRPRWRSVTMAAILVVSLALTFGGPYMGLTRLLPALTVVRVPPRWVIPATFALAALAGFGVAGLMGAGRRGIGGSGVRHQVSGIGGSGDQVKGDSATPGFRKFWTAFVLVLGLLLVIESFAAPLPLASVGKMDDLPPVYHALRGEGTFDPSGRAVVELPMHVAPAPEFPEAKRLYSSTTGWWGLVNGYSGFTPARQTTLGRALAGFPDEEALGTLQGLAADGVRYLIVHPGEAPMDRATWEMTGRWEAERGTGLIPVGRFGPDELYLINPYGDELISDPSAVTDPYWSARAPEPVSVRFTVPNSDAEVRLLAFAYQPNGWEIGRLEGWGDGGSPDLQSSSPLSEPRLTLYWQTSAPLDTDYTVFVHGLSAEGELVGQADGPPLAGHYATTAWGPGEIVQDSRPLPPGGRYLVGLYDPASGERLPAYAYDGTRLADDAVPLPVTGVR